MKSLASTLALGFLLAWSHVSAAPAPQAVPATNSTAASTPAPTETAIPEALLSVFAESDRVDESSYGGANFEKMRKKYKKYIKNTLKKRKARDSCSLDKLTVRKEW
jgi:hypothetical protein